jgi:cysteine synthase B
VTAGVPAARDGAALEHARAHPLVRRIGETPLVELRRLAPADVRVYAKLEDRNPGGSVKDRAARGIVLDAIERGLLPARRLLDSTSGNTGIAYAMLGAALGFGVTLCVPASAGSERRRILHAYGAEVVETDPGEGSDGARGSCAGPAPGRCARRWSRTTPCTGSRG